MSSLEEWRQQVMPPGSARERNYRRYSRSQDIRWAVLANTMGRIPLVGRIVMTFWEGTINDQPGHGLISPSGGAWSLSFEYLGDYLFYHEPMTTDYFERWYSRIPWPRWLHLHRPCCAIVRWRDAEGLPCHTQSRCTRRGG